MGRVPQLFADDLSSDFAFSGEAKTLTEEHFTQFAALTGDKHPIHYDPAYRGQDAVRPADRARPAADLPDGARCDRDVGAVEDAMIAMVEQRWQFLQPGLRRRRGRRRVSRSGSNQPDQQRPHSARIGDRRVRLRNQAGTVLLEGRHVYLIRRRVRSRRTRNEAGVRRQAELRAGRAAFDWAMALDDLGWSDGTVGRPRRDDRRPACARRAAPNGRRSSGSAPTARERRITFGELSRQSARFGNLLRRLGVRAGDRVATVLPRIPEAMPAIIGALPRRRHPGADLHRLRAGRGRLSACAQRRQGGLRRRPLSRIWCRRIDGMTVVTIGGIAVRSGGDIDGDAALGRESDACEPARYERNEPAVIIYTSGSTGQPKGCVIAANILAAMWPYVRYGLDLRADTDVFWPTGDPSWGYGLCCYLPALATGAPVLCVEANATPEVCRDIIERLQGQQSRHHADRAAQPDGARRRHPRRRARRCARSRAAASR